MNTKLLVAFGLAFIGGCSFAGIDFGKTSNAYAGGAGGTGGESIAACSCDSEFVNGTRLTAKTSHTEDGTKFRRDNQFFDAELNIDCSFVETPFDGLRCLPKHKVVNYFVDAECTIPMYVHKNPCEPIPEWIRVDVADAPPAGACGTTYHASNMYKIGEEQVGQAKYYFVAPDGWCGGGSADLANGQRVYVAKKGPNMINFGLASNN